MYWKLILSQQEGKLELHDEDSVLAVKGWVEDRHTSEEILTGMKELLQETGLRYADVPELRLELDLPPHATARRIAETIQNVYTTFVSYG
jgi:8-oxo-dGTP pyrophosphatase MutT (NUDIX family)